MPHGFDYTSSVTYGDTFPSKGKARVQRIILPQIRTITAYSDPSVITDAMTAPLTQGSQGMRCKKSVPRLREAKRHGFYHCSDTGLLQKTYP